MDISFNKLTNSDKVYNIYKEVLEQIRQYAT